MSAVALETPQPARRRRRVWLWVLAGVVALLAGAVVAGEALARGWAEDAIASRVAAALDVPRGTPVDAELGGGPLVVQLVSGSLELVEVRIDGLALGPLVGDLRITASGVPFDESRATQRLIAEYAIPEAALEEAAMHVTGAPVESIELAEPEIVASGTLDVLGAAVPLGLGLTPTADDGALVFSVTTLRVGERQLDVASASTDPFWGPIASAVLQERRLCVADRLPAALTLTRAEVEGATVRLVLDGSGAALGGEAFRTKGECAA